MWFPIQSLKIQMTSLQYKSVAWKLFLYGMIVNAVVKGEEKASKSQFKKKKLSIPINS